MRVWDGLALAALRSAICLLLSRMNRQRPHLRPRGPVVFGTLTPPLITASACRSDGSVPLYGLGHAERL